MKKLTKSIIGLAGVGVGLGLGTALVEKAGGDPTALTTASSFVPLAVPIIAGGYVIKQVKDLNKIKVEKRKPLW